MNSSKIGEVLLDVVQENSKKGPGYFQQNQILRETANRLKIKGNIELEQALLTKWNDLFRTGHIAWGSNLDNPNSPFCHITQKGRLALQRVSRDPGNPDGYLQYLYTISNINPVAKSYVEEALATFNNNCYKATAVMIGAAAESTLLELRDTFVSKMTTLNKPIPNNLKDWKIKTVTDEMTKLFEAEKRQMPRPLYERFSAHWSSVAGQIRISRNDAGHPSSIEPVTEDMVYASLLTFPELVDLIKHLSEWVTNFYQ